MTPDVFTSMLRTEYLQAKMDAEALGPAPVERFCTKIPSDSKIENMVFGTAVGHMRKFTGKRTFQKFAADVYPIENIRYDNGFEVNKDDVDDDKVGIYKLMPKGVVDKSKLLPAQLALEAIRLGETGLGFDRTAYHAESHNVGTVKGTIAGGEGGGNVLTVTAASADGVAHKVVLMVNNGSTIIKPIVITERMPVSELQTDAGTPEAEKAVKYQYWLDARYGVGYGFWWDSMLIKITNTPTQTELQTYLGKAETRLRRFLLQKERSDDQDLAFHEQLNFNADTITVLHGTALTNMMRNVLTSDTIVQSGAPVTNQYKGWGYPLPTIYLDA